MELAIQPRTRDEIKEGLKKHLARSMGRIRKLHDARKNPGIELSGRRAQAIDSLIKLAIKETGYAKTPGIAIGALGGYGRNEFCPYSDVDLIVLYDPRAYDQARELAETMLYLLWDLNLELGHSVRTIDECINLSITDDVTVLTSLLDGRLITGDSKLWGELTRRLYRELLPSISSEFIRKKLVEHEDRMNRFGRSVYLSEPHVKEGEGTLRDINNALWIAKAKYKVLSFNELLEKTILTSKDVRGFEKGLDFLLTVRSELHYLAGRKEDVLGFGWQQKVAEYLGYKNMGGLPAVERFMRVFYLHANQIKEYSARLIGICTSKPRLKFKADTRTVLEGGFMMRSGELNTTSPGVILETPANMMKAFEYADEYGIELSGQLKDLIRNNLHLIDDNVRRDPELNASFLRLLRDGKNVSKALFDMNRIRLLGHYIAEFGKIVCLAQHDAYHVYPVDIHSIFMVQEIERQRTGVNVESFPVITEIASSLKNRHILYLACLMHDMGKGQGRDHSKRGAAMVPKIAERMGLGHREMKQLQYLVHQHLIMPHISQRRDMHDQSLIKQFAKSLKSIETLDHLFLLTFADMRSVGPDVWTNWKGMLLKELYLRTAAVLEGKPLHLESLDAHADAMKKKVVDTLEGQIDRERVLEFLEGMPSSYFNVFSRKTIAYHVRTLEKFGEEAGTVVNHNTAEGFDEFIYWGRDEVGIFTKISGVLAASGLNIMGARIVTRGDGRILDVFYVNRNGRSTYEDPSVWAKVRKNLFAVLRGKADVDELVLKRQGTGLTLEKQVPRLPTRIEFDNTSSQGSTVVDIYTHDREGLLYLISNTLNKLGLSINYAKISTKVDQVADVFYVTDTEDRKITDKATLKRIESGLMSAIGGDK